MRRQLGRGLGHNRHGHEISHNYQERTRAYRFRGFPPLSIILTSVEVILDQISDQVRLQGWIAEEIRLSDECADPAAAQIHRKLAGLYASRLSELRQQAPVVALMPPMLSG